MDQGVIWSLKSKYRTRIIQKVLSAIDQGKQLPVISILEAMKVLALSWSEVSKETTNCFTKSGFLEDVCSEEDGDPFLQLWEALDKLCAHGQEFVPDGLQCEDIVNVDRDVHVTEGLLTEEEIVEEIRDIFDEENENDDVEIAERSEDIPIKPNSQEVFRAIKTLLDYSMCTNSGEVGKLATKTSSMVEKENLELKRQKKITDFFFNYWLKKGFMLIYILCSISFVTFLNIPDKSD